MPERPPRIIVVNDNPEFLELVGEFLTDERYVVTLIDGDQPNLVGQIRDARADMLMVDLRMGTEGPHGLDLVRQMQRDPELAELPTLICSADIVGLSEIEQTIGAMPRVITLSKPFALDELSAAIDSLLGSA